MHLESLATCSAPTVYPFGYSSRYAMQRIDDLMREPMTLLIDTRYKPTSQMSQWRRRTLEQVYGERYRWAGEHLGNIHFDTDLPIELADPDPGIARLCEYLQHGYRLILLCQCPNYAYCHRNVIVQLLLKAMPSVQIIQPEALPEVLGYHCLSIRQPYAHWLANPTLFTEHDLPPKIVENRDWLTRHRGELLLHASATFEAGALNYWSRRIPGLSSVVPREKKAYAQGAIIGIAQLAGIIETSSDPWFCGAYGFVLKDAQPIGPIHYPGALKIFEVPRSVVDLQMRTSEATVLTRR
jgi:hypothetical protein